MTINSPCCTPRTKRVAQIPIDPQPVGDNVNPSLQAQSYNDLGPNIHVVPVPGGEALLGTDHPAIALDEEGPTTRKQLQPFNMMQGSVTNELFEAFVNDTGYVTDAERFGWSFVFHTELDKTDNRRDYVAGSPWWRKTRGANWRYINGPDNTDAIEPDHPVVHVSWNDANAFAKWIGGRLPSESEWEHAARGGLGDVPFPWGYREPDDTSFQPCNIWQGSFPTHNNCTDGYFATAPVMSYEPNGYGLYNMCGNVWEWTSGRFKIKSRTKEAKRHAKQMQGTKVLKGGSFLCHKSYCFRYRIAARTGTTPDSTTAHQGFRLVFDT